MDDACSSGQRPPASRKERRRSRRYLALALGLVLLGSGGIAAANALMDPLWLFPYEHPLNRVQREFDERAQKTNWLAARAGRFDAVLLGSSRSTYINQNDFAPLSLFNYAVNAMWPRDYRAFLDHVTAVNGRPPELVVLGVDFYGSRAEPVGDTRPPEPYFAQAGQPAYVAGSLLSLPLLKRSLRVASDSLELVRLAHDLDRYDRHNVRRMARGIEREEREAATRRNVATYRHHIFGPGYRYNDELAALLRELRDAYPDTRFVVFTTPIRQPLLEAIVEAGRLPDHARWLADLTAVFGEVWDFMGPNSVTTEPAWYRDDQHFSEAIGRLIADRLMGRPVPERFADFGRRVTPESLEAHLGWLYRRLDVQAPRPEPGAPEAPGALSPA